MTKFSIDTSLVKVGSSENDYGGDVKARGLQNYWVA